MSDEEIIEAYNEGKIDGKNKIAKAIRKVINEWEPNFDDKVAYGEMKLDVENAIDNQFSRT